MAKTRPETADEIFRIAEHNKKAIVESLHAPMKSVSCSLRV